MSGTPTPRPNVAGSPTPSLAPLSLARVEDALLATWPAARTVRDGAWVWRARDGFTDRANAASCHDASDDADLGARLDAMCAFYRAQGLPPQLRETALMPRGAVGWARERGWKAHSETVLLAGPLPQGAAIDANVMRHDLLTPTGRLRWLDDARSCSARLRDPAAVSLIADLAVPSLGLTAHENGTAVSVAQLGVFRGLATLHNVATAPAARGKGHAGRVLAAALADAAALGAGGFWLAVEADNAAALSLYAPLGLTEIGRYRYWTPRKDTP